MSHLAESINQVEATLPAILLLQEAADALRTSTRNLRRLIAQGRIGAVREKSTGSSRVLIPRGEVTRYLLSMVQP